jgi:hypothetical protein
MKIPKDLSKKAARNHPLIKPPTPYCHYTLYTVILATYPPPTIQDFPSLTPGKQTVAQEGRHQVTHGTINSYVNNIIHTNLLMGI